MSDLPPQNNDAETAVLSCLLSGYRDVPDVAAIVSPADFYSPAHETIFAACLALHETGRRVDPLTVRDALPTDARIDPVYLHTLQESAPHVANALVYAAQVADAAFSRRLVDAAARTRQVAGSTLTSAEKAEHARQWLDEATRVTAAHVGTVGESLEVVIEQAQKGRARALGTPWPDLDRTIRGLAPGRLVVVGARPGGGKSLIGAQLATHMVAKHGHSAYLASMEMSREEVTQRILAATAKVDLSRLENGELTEREWELVRDHHDAIGAWPLHVDDSPSQTVATIRSTVRDLARTQTVAVVVVDYLQLLTPRDRRVPRHEQVGEMSQGLKLMARELNVCVVAMAQVNRAPTARTDKEPTLGDLRESGSIEADADVVILLHRPNEESPDVEVIVAKQRNGPLGRCTLQLQGHYARLVPQAWSPSRAIA